MRKFAYKWILLSTGTFLLCFPQKICANEPELLSMPGKLFPDFTFHTRLNKKEMSYLGIPQRRFLGFLGRKKTQSFTIMDVPADLVILEFFNVHCISCQAHAPVMNRVYSLIQKDKNLKAGKWNKMKIRVVGDQVTTWLNGVEMVTLTDEKIGQGEGSIALQIHDGGGIKVKWRNLVIKEL